MEPDSLVKAADGCRAAYYLVHAMLSGKSRFVDADHQAAHHMVSAAAASGLEQIIYLGGLVENAAPASPHLRFRLEVGRIPTAIETRARLNKKAEPRKAPPF